MQKWIVKYGAVGPGGGPNTTVEWPATAEVDADSESDAKEKGFYARPAHFLVVVGVEPKE